MAFGADESKLVSIFHSNLTGHTLSFSDSPSGSSYGVVLLGRRINKLMFWISIIMFIFATMHIGVNYARVFLAFITYRNAEGGPAAFFNMLSNFTQIFGSTIYVAQTLLVRCYIVWGRQLSIVAFPILLLLGSTVCGIGILYSFAHIGDAEVFALQLQDWIVSFFSLTLSTNIICTALVAYRIWYVNRSVISFSNHSWSPVMLLVVESGAIYSVTLLSLLILYKTESWFQYVLLDAISPIVGLVFSMIIVRIGLGLVAPTGETHYLSTTLQQASSCGTRHSGMHHLGPFVAARGGTATTSTESRISVPPGPAGAKSNFIASISEVDAV
ncbi:hypothetical protein BT96DRAFT_983229 [Gymnopus androsaceus JB14]|uniref:Uncharacterized protein n=1 Tax=Gymnopus androsaceus JB14 TaxID=1447944 RepID=A0A6A4IV23_9AGAR|nr:hypothetical protein BT96DRAFT_983229 [Gymnopus androsaceus JB14]